MRTNHDRRGVERRFSNLRKQLDAVERRYNPKDENLHFECLSHGDAYLYPEILRLARDGLKQVQRLDTYFKIHDLYDDGMFLYDLFLLISAGANRVRKDGAQNYIPDAQVSELLTLLVEIARYAAVRPADIAKRNYEALGNTLLAFYSKERVRLLRREVRTASKTAKGLVRSAILKVEELRAAS